MPFLVVTCEFKVSYKFCSFMSIILIQIGLKVIKLCDYEVLTYDVKNTKKNGKILSTYQ